MLDPDAAPSSPGTAHRGTSAPDAPVTAPRAPATAPRRATGSPEPGDRRPTDHGGPAEPREVSDARHGCGCRDEAVTPSRRTVVGGAGVVALGTFTAAGCGSDDRRTDSGSGTSSAAPDPGTRGGHGPGGQRLNAGPLPLGTVESIPVGGALSTTSPAGPLVLARPAPDEVLAFDARCTHKGCPVSVRGDELTCPCHGARFATSTGEVIAGPAASPLRQVRVTLRDGKIYRG